MEDNSPAAKVDIRTYDVIRQVDGQRVNSASDLVSRIAAMPPGTKVGLEVWRNKETLEVEATLGERPSTPQRTAPEPEPNILGMTLLDLSAPIAERLGLEPGTTGVLVTGVEPGSPAEEAGLAQGDILMEIGQRPVTNLQELKGVISELGAPGKSFLVRYLREGRRPIAVIKVPEAGATSTQ